MRWHDPMHVGYDGDVAAAQVLPGCGRRAQFHSRRGARGGGAADVVAAAQGARRRAGSAARRPRRPRRAHAHRGGSGRAAVRAADPRRRRRRAAWPSRRSSGLARGRVRVGATPSLCSGVLADVLRVFHEQYPAIALELAESGSQPLVRSLVRGELDIALVIVPASGADPALHAVPLLRERLSVASAASGRATVVARLDGAAGAGPPVARRAPGGLRPAGVHAARVRRRRGHARGSPCRVGRWTPCCGWSRRAPGWRWCPTSCSPGARACGARCSPPRSTGRSRSPRGRTCGPSQATGAFRATLLTFLAELSAVGGFPGDVQVLRRPDP